MSLHWRILGSNVVVIVLTVLIGVGVVYYGTESSLGVFVDRIGGEEASRLARSLSRAYTAAGGWDTVDGSLSEAGYSYSEAPHEEGSGEGGGEGSERFHQDSVRVVVASVDGRVVKDNLSQLAVGADVPDLDGYRETVFDLATNSPVGHVYVDVNGNFLSTESHGFLSTLLYIIAIGGALTIGVAILLAAWLSRRITSPVTALTDATQAIAQGDTTRLPVTSADELERMSAAFNRMSATLETQRALRRRLINDVSHELNTPLSVIQLEATGLRDGIQTPEDASNHIIQEVERLRGLVTDLNWLAETDHGELQLTFESCSLYALLAAETQRWQPQAQARQVALSLEADADLPEMPLDRMRMGQALGNVLNNAIRCTEANGRILVRAKSEGEGAVAVTVTDDGIGVEAEDLPHVFERFYRTNQSRRNGIGGTGLGLAITRAVVEAHGGTVAITSDGPGQGAAVTFRLPLVG